MQLGKLMALPLGCISNNNPLRRMEKLERPLLVIVKESDLLMV